MPAVSVIGHVTRDLIRIPGRDDRAQPGGSALYAASALAALEVDLEVITKLSVEDTAMLDNLAGPYTGLICLPSAATTTFENVYSGPTLAQRTQRVLAVADPFTDAEIERGAAPFLLFGPLTANDIPLAKLAKIRSTGQRVALDGQGLLRRVAGDQITRAAADVALIGRSVDVLKVDDEEARALTGLEPALTCAERLIALGVEEVLVTFADRGSLVVTEAGHFEIPAVDPGKIVDATGCGDTYLASYIAARICGRQPRGAGRFASAAASLKLRAYGPSRATREAIEMHLEGAEHPLR